MAAPTSRRSHGLSQREEPWLLTQEKAQRRAAQIREYWRQREVDVEVWVELLAGTGAADEYAVRSSLALCATPAAERVR